MNLFDFEMQLASADNDLNGLLTLLELSWQRGDSAEKFQQILARVQGKLKELGQQLTDLSSQEVTTEAESGK